MPRQYVLQGPIPSLLRFQVNVTLMMGGGLLLLSAPGYVGGAVYGAYKQGLGEEPFSIREVGNSARYGAFLTAFGPVIATTCAITFVTTLPVKAIYGAGRLVNKLKSKD